MIFSKKTRRTTSMPKIEGFIEAFGSYRPKLSKLSILVKNGLNGQSFAISEFSRHIEYGCLKGDHKKIFHTKNKDDS